MKKITIMIVLAAVMAAVSMADTKTTYRDSHGRVTRTVTTDSYGKTTWRDGYGRIQGSSRTDRYGKTTYYDALGRMTGTKTTKLPKNAFFRRGAASARLTANEDK